jgi:hypothetical protein
MLARPMQTSFSERTHNMDAFPNEFSQSVMDALRADLLRTRVCMSVTEQRARRLATMGTARPPTTSSPGPTTIKAQGRQRAAQRLASAFERNRGRVSALIVRAAPGEQAHHPDSAILVHAHSTRNISRSWSVLN